MIAVTISDLAHMPDSADCLLCFAAISAGESVGESAVVYAFAVICMRLQTQQIHARQQQNPRETASNSVPYLAK